MKRGGRETESEIARMIEIGAERDSDRETKGDGDREKERETE